MKKKYRFTILMLVILVIAVVTILVVHKNGDHFTLRYASNHFGDWVKEKPDNFKFTIENESVVRAEKAYFDKDNIFCIDLVAVGKGRTAIDATVGNNYPLVKTVVKVTSHNFIYEEFLLNFNGYKTVEYIILLCFAIIAAVMIFSYVECWKKAEFSYSMVAYGGFGLFLTAIDVYALYYMHTFDNFRFALYTMSETGYYFVIVATPLIILLSGLCAFSNLWLVRHEGFRGRNLLGIILSIISITGSFIVILGRHSSHALASMNVHDTLFLAMAYIASFLICIFLFIILTAFLSTRHYPAFDKDYVIILGCGIRKDGSLTPLLKGRVDAAIKFENEQFEKTGRHAKFVPSGGKGPDEVISESEAMTKYLLEQGIPEERILKEDKSINTWQNIKFSRDVIWNDAGGDKNAKAAFATTNYHIFRGYTLSHEHGLLNEGISAKTKWYFFPNAFLREFAGIMVARRRHLFGLAILIFVISAVIHMALI